MKTRVAVFFGGRSPEHDVSIVSGLQALSAIDQQRYDAFPVYVATDGGWWIGEALRDRSSYIPHGSVLKSLDSVSLEIGSNLKGRGRLVCGKPTGLFSKAKVIDFDVAFLAFHGLSGEDGRVQGLFEVANIPYTGMRPLGSGILMDKRITKRVLSGLGIPLLDHVILERPAMGMISAADLSCQLEGVDFPLIVKPVRLGSSIGVARVASIEELRAALPLIFRLDTQAIVESFVENLVEYNIAVAHIDGSIRTSAIERPKSLSELLDFKSKYLSGGANKASGKIPGQHSQGMLSLTRDINPVLPSQIELNIRRWAMTCFDAVSGSGAPRIDFLANAKTGEVWLNEVNPCPGSFGFFLWEAAERPILFSELVHHLIEEAFRLHGALQLPVDTTPPDARLFSRD